MADQKTNTTQDAATAAFIARWSGVQLTDASELSSSQTFVLELCALLGVPTPLPSAERDYMFERPITFAHGDGSTSAGRIDCYRRASFVWESKKLRYTALGGKRFDSAMLTARSQAEGYARALPAADIAHGRPPFLIVADVGHVLEIYADFTRSGATYTPFPDPRHHRIRLSDLHDAALRQRLSSIWLDPLSLDPSRASARVTREVSDQLAALATSLEKSGHRAEHVAAFLTRCLFSMFAEDVELLPKGSFVGLLRQHGKSPATLQSMLRTLWADMDTGGFSAALATQVLRFNGKLFKMSAADGYSLLLNAEQIERLTRAAMCNWREVEPAIFGTLLERALHVDERHALGAHYTPRAYVERLVLPTVVEPLRQQWQAALAAALVLASEAAELSGKAADAKLADARGHIRQFHQQLCSLRVLDPACGSGNFLYVTLEHLKRLEGEVVNQLEAFGDTQGTLGLEGQTVSPRQLLGIELNERAAALAELVLWIGYLQWHIRTRGNSAVAEPVVHDFGNIEHRDAVLAAADTELAYDANGQLITRWDGKSYKPHPTTRQPVPDEAAAIAEWTYIAPRQATWPEADYIIGNPPFIGASTMRSALGDGYVQALRKVWPEVPESADFVMHWWARAAALVAHGSAKRFGLITTNSLRQTFNRRVVQAALDGQAVLHSGKGRAQPIVLTFAIADHPWVDNARGAAVRIAMTVGERAPAASAAAKRGKASATAKMTAKSAAKPGFKPRAKAVPSAPGRLQTVTSETTGAYGEVTVTVSELVGLIHSDLSVGANVTRAVGLQSNFDLSCPGVKLHGSGFIVTKEQAISLGLGKTPKLDRHIREYRNGRDLTNTPRHVLVIDLSGLSVEQVHSSFPAVYQHVLSHVKPERESNNRASYRENWWFFGEPRMELRLALSGLPRYIATVETAKHRTFQFLDARILPDNKLVAIATADAFHLGVLSSHLHGAWALATGSWLGVGNDPVYVKSRCFETFPVPADDTGLTPALRERIADLAEQIDAHRKRQQAAHPSLTLTGMYNGLQVLADGRALTDKEITIHTEGLLSVLAGLHAELDAAVLSAYGWSDLADQARFASSPDQTDRQDTLLARLLALNAQRAQEETEGYIRWLRPAFQDPSLAKSSSNSLSNNELLAHSPVALQTNLALDNLHENESKDSQASASSTAEGTTKQGTFAAPQTTPATRLPWPGSLPEQVAAVAHVLQQTPAALSVAALEAHFSSQGAWRKSLPRILLTLQALGLAHSDASGPDQLVRWRSA